MEKTDDVYAAPDDLSDMSISPITSPGLSPTPALERELMSPSPAPSVTSYSSSDRLQLVQEFHGRELNTINDLWRLPADSEEYNRHDIQHRVVKEALGSLYAVPELVQQALSPQQDVLPAILDVGTGSGRWAIDMAMEFRHAEVVAIDLAPPILDSPIPDNLRFEIDDLNLSLEHYSGCFNVVHSRAVDNGIKDFRGYLYNLAQVLRPNGVLLLARPLLQLYDENLQPLPAVGEGSPGFNPIQNLFASTARCVELLGGTQGHSMYWKQYLEANENYKQIGTMWANIPVGAWQSGLDENSYQVAELHRLNTFKAIYTVRPLLLKGGIPETVVDRWLELGSSDLRNGTARIFARWEWAWAIRTSAKWTPPPQM